MELYLIRHGIAAERTEYDDDEKRPLTEKGREKTEKIAQRLHELGVRFDLIMTSPLVRAWETAEILQKAGLSEKIEVNSSLAPEGYLRSWVNWYEQSGYNEQLNYLALVGHQPNLGNWAETLVWGNSQGKLTVKKAGIIGVQFPETEKPIGSCSLFLLTAPKWFI